MEFDIFRYVSIFLTRFGHKLRSPKQDSLLCFSRIGPIIISTFEVGVASVRRASFSR